MPQYTVRFKASADKAMRKLPHQIQERIALAVKALREDPRPRGCKKLKGADDLWRIRVGEYRVVYTIRDDELLVLVVRVAHRKDVYD